MERRPARPGFNTKRKAIGSRLPGANLLLAPPLATAAVVTAAVVGSIVHSIPPSCTSVIVNGFNYQQCGSTWYQPQFSGSTTTYVVVNAPR